jgi:hypothetical protein
MKTFYNMWISYFNIEWKYFAITNESFKGIIGVSKFNENYIIPSFFMDGGYLVIVAGIISIGEDSKKICIMKMISPSKVYDTDSELLIKDSEQNICLSIDFENENEINIFVHVDTNIFDFTIKRIASPLKLQNGNDFLGGLFQWNVHNLIPLGEIEGVISFKFKLNNHQDKISLKPGNNSCYYEHSWGNVPLCFFGWDFFYCSDPTNNCFIILQNYFGSNQLSYIDIFFDNRLIHVPFRSKYVKVKYTYEFNSIIKTKVPKTRSFRISYDDYEIDICYLVVDNIPFLRNESFLINNFFINEEFARLSYFITNKKTGKMIVDAKNVLCGGEYSHFSFPYKNIFVGGLIVFLFSCFFMKLQIFTFTW